MCPTSCSIVPGGAGKDPSGGGVGRYLARLITATQGGWVGVSLGWSITSWDGETFG